MTGQFFFWAGLAAVAAFFAAAASLAFGFFAASPRARARLAAGQGALLALTVAFAAWAALILRARLAPWSVAPQPAEASALLGAMRETMSLLLLGLSVTASALLTAIAQLRLGRAGAAFRAVLWVFPGLRLVAASVGALDYFDGLRAAAGEPVQAAAVWQSYAADAARGLLIAAGAAAALGLLSWPLGRLLARRRAAAPAE